MSPVPLQPGCTYSEDCPQVSLLHLQLGKLSGTSQTSFSSSTSQCPVCLPCSKQTNWVYSKYGTFFTPRLPKSTYCLFYSCNLFKQEFWVVRACSTSDNRDVVVEWVRQSSSGSVFFWRSKRVVDGNQHGNALRLGNVSICDLRYGCSVGKGVKNTYGTWS